MSLMMTSDHRNRLRETAPYERPQERLQQHGAASLCDADLIAMLLRSGTRSQDVMTLSSRMIAEAGSIAALLTWTEMDFRRHKGIGRVKALQLMAVLELARRAILQHHSNTPLLNDADSVVGYLAPIAAGLTVEKFWVLCLNRKGRLIKRTEASSGIASSTLVHPREVFREAIREAASSIICAHNHPSGDPSPSPQDVTITRNLRNAAAIVEIDLIDHVIIGRPESDPRGIGHYSFKASGVV